MEDWAYAAAFDPALLSNCTVFSQELSPFMGGRSPREDSQNLRATVFLVETADQKQPQDKTLGTDEQPLDSNTALGHVPRNARVALTAVDFAQPYVCFAKSTKKMPDATGLWAPSQVHWYVGGAEQVTETFLSVHKPPENAQQLLKDAAQGLWTPILNAMHQPGDTAPVTLAATVALAQAGAEVLRFASSVRKGRPGKARWGGADVFRPQLLSASALGSTKATLRRLGDGTFWVVAWAKVDEAWGHGGQGSPSSTGPQSYMARQRTDPSYRASSTLDLRRKGVRRVVRGRTYWPSDPMVVDIRGGRVSVLSAVTECAWWAS
jgi:hypothetical protein